MNTWHFHFLNWQRVHLCGPSPFLLFILDYLLAFPQWCRLNLTYCLNFFLLLALLAFCFMLVCMVDQTQICPLSISPLGLFQKIICNIERLKERTLEPWLTWGGWLTRGIPDLKGGTSDTLSYHGCTGINSWKVKGKSAESVVFWYPGAVRIKSLIRSHIQCLTIDRDIERQSKIVVTVN